MKIRHIKPGHVTNCPFCKAEGNKVQAVWHLTGENKQACDEHKPRLQSIRDKANSAREEPSMADEMTWMRL